MLVHTSNLFFHPFQARAGGEALRGCRASTASFFCNSGTEAVEACLKFARRYWFTQRRAAADEVRGADARVPRPHVRVAVGDGGSALPRAVRAAGAGRDVRRPRRSGGARRGGHRRDGGDRRSSRFRAKVACVRCRGVRGGRAGAAAARTGALVIADEVQSGPGPDGPRVLLAGPRPASPISSRSARRSAPASRSAPRCCGDGRRRPSRLATTAARTAATCWRAAPASTSSISCSRAACWRTSRRVGAHFERRLRELAARIRW